MQDDTRDPLEALRFELTRLDWVERDAYRALLTAIEAHPPAQDAYRRWLRVREERETVAVRIDVLRAALAARKRGGP